MLKRKVEKSEKDLEIERERFLSKGGLVKADIEKKDEYRKAITLRIPIEWLEQIDKSVEGKCGMNRTAWLLQAAQEKLERDL